jgi:hypothetical protein
MHERITDRPRDPEDRITDEPPCPWDGIISKPRPAGPRELPSWLRPDAEPSPSILSFVLRTITIWAMLLLGGFLAMGAWWVRVQFAK